MKGGRPALNYAYRGGHTDPNTTVLERTLQRMAMGQRSGGSQVASKSKVIRATIGDVICIENDSLDPADRPKVYLPKVNGDMTGKSIWVTFAAKGTTAYYSVTAPDPIDGHDAGQLFDGNIVPSCVTQQYFCAGPGYGWRTHYLNNA